MCCNFQEMQVEVSLKGKGAFTRCLDARGPSGILVRWALCLWCRLSNQSNLHQWLATVPPTHTPTTICFHRQSLLLPDVLTTNTNPCGAQSCPVPWPALISITPKVPLKPFDSSVPGICFNLLQSVWFVYRHNYKLVLLIKQNLASKEN